MNLKKLLSILCLFALLLNTSSAYAIMAANSKEDMYSKAIEGLETYLETPKDNNAMLVGLLSTFVDLGSYEYSNFFAYYVSALKKVANEEYDYELYTTMDILSANNLFAAHLNDLRSSSSIGTIDELKTYVSAREDEYNGNKTQAREKYYQCINFFDASDRYIKMPVPEPYDYTVAKELLSQKDFVGAYFSFANANGYGDSTEMMENIVNLLGYTPSSPADNPQAAASNAQYLTYEILADGTLEITGISGDYPQDFEIPQEIDEHIITSIGKYAFSDCSNLMSVIIPNSVISIGNNAFEDCSNLTRVTIPNSVTSIDYNAFSCCSSLTSVTIPNSVTRIGDAAFYFCNSLTSVTIPDSVTSIGGAPFSACMKLTKIIVDSGNSSFCSDNGVLLDKAKTKLIQCPAGMTGTYAIPSGVTDISVAGFIDCSSLMSVTIPNSVTNIDDHAFVGCISLTRVMIPNSVTSIGQYAFYNCSSLTSVTIPNSVISIADDAFTDCNSLISVIVDRGSYAENYCKSNGLKFTYAR